MAAELSHQPAAAYALDALSLEEERRYEAHLALCPRCQEEVASFSETAAALGYAVSPAGAPQPALRERVLAAARAQRPAKVVRVRPRWALPALAAAAAATCAAIGLGTWAATLNSRTHTGTLQTLPLRGANGSVIIARGGEAALVLSGLPHAPAGHTYEVWVMHGQAATPAALFTATKPTTTIRLRQPLPTGSFVGVTLEPAGGSPHPTSPTIVTSTPA